MSATPLSPSAYRMALADRVRARLFEQLGPECAECGCDLRECAWEVNHIYRREWRIRTLNRYRRHLRYQREAAQGLINLLCQPCNSVYRPMPMPKQRVRRADPF